MCCACVEAGFDYTIRGQRVVVGGGHDCRFNERGVLLAFHGIQYVVEDLTGI